MQIYWLSFWVLMGRFCTASVPCKGYSVLQGLTCSLLTSQPVQQVLLYVTKGQPIFWTQFLVSLQSEYPVYIDCGLNLAYYNATFGSFSITVVQIEGSPPSMGSIYLSCFKKGSSYPKSIQFTVRYCDIPPKPTSIATNLMYSFSNCESFQQYNYQNRVSLLYNNKSCIPGTLQNLSNERMPAIRSQSSKVCLSNHGSSQAIERKCRYSNQGSSAFHLFAVREDSYCLILELMGVRVIQLFNICLYPISKGEHCLRSGLREQLYCSASERWASDRRVQSEGWFLSHNSEIAKEVRLKFDLKAGLAIGLQQLEAKQKQFLQFQASTFLHRLFTCLELILSILDIRY